MTEISKIQLCDFMAVSMDGRGSVLTPEMERFIRKMGQFYENIGITHISGMIMGLLLIWAKPISPEEISHILRISRSSVSTNLKLLKMYGYLEEMKQSGIRKKFYIFSDSAWQNSIRVRLNMYDPFQNILQEGIEILKKNKEPDRSLKEIIAFMKIEKEFYVKALDNWDKMVKKDK